MTTEIDKLPETQPDFDTSAALADISSDLFGQGSSEEGAVETPAEGAEVSDSSGPSAVESESQPQSEEATSGENSEEVQALGAPSTWTKEALQEWASIPPRAQAEILKREGDFLNGIMKYKSGAEIGQRYESVVEPYKAILTAENIDPVQLFQSFAANHYLLSRGTPEQKTQLAANLITSYGIDLDNLLEHIGSTPTQSVDPEVAALRKEISDLRSQIGSTTQAQTAAIQTQIDREVEAFASDPNHPYFDELVNDIAKLIETGLATGLPDAYEKAVYANPVTRQKEIDRLTALRQSEAASAAEERQRKIARTTAADVTITPTQRNGTVPVGSMDDTLQETLAAIMSRS